MLGNHKNFFSHSIFFFFVNLVCRVSLYFSLVKLLHW